MNIYLMIIGSVLLLMNLLPAKLSGEQIRGLWVVRHNLTNKQKIDSLLSFASRCRFTDLFVQVRGRGDAYYNSHFEPPAEDLEEDFDPLEYLLHQPARQHFRIHVWINVFYLWSSDKLPKSPVHLVNRQPDWIVYPVHYDSSLADSNYAGRRNEEGLYLSPMIPEVQKHLINVVHDLLSQYHLDGVHLDYIRFPGYEFDFNPVARENFAQRYILDPLEFRRDANLFVDNYGPTGFDLFFSRWADFLREGHSGFVKTLSLSIREKYPNIIISAAVKPDLEKAYWRYYQEWDRWLQQGWLDWAVPMNYASQKSLFMSRLEGLLNMEKSDHLLMGIALYNQPADSSLSKVQLIQKLSLSGYVLFSYDQIVNDKKFQLLYRKKILKTEAKK